MTERTWTIPTRADLRRRYAELLGIGFLVGFITGSFVVLAGLGVLR